MASCVLDDVDGAPRSPPSAGMLAGMNAAEEPAADREVDVAERARLRAEFRERLAVMDREWTPERWAELRTRHGRDAADAV